jgi:hypothetical protein
MTSPRRHLANLGEWVPSNEYNDSWLCPCGNDPMQDGFANVRVTLAYDEKNVGDDTKVICQRCGRIMDPSTHEVNPTPPPWSESWHDELSHRVRIVGFFPITSAFFNTKESQ